MLLEGIGILRESTNKQNRLHGSRRCVSVRIKKNLFLILGHFEKTRMFFQSAFAANKSVSLSLSILVQGHTISAKCAFRCLTLRPLYRHCYTSP